jgi:hypothetical protein
MTNASFGQQRNHESKAQAQRFDELWATLVSQCPQSMNGLSSWGFSNQIVSSIEHRHD